MRRTIRTVGLVSVLACCAALALAGPAYAGKGASGAGGGGGKGGGGTTGGTSTMTLVLVDSTDGVPHWGQHIRFNVSTTATTKPYVDVTCSQGGTLVYSASTGYFDGYPWPWTNTFVLQSPSWTGGAASCSARLYSQANSGSQTTLKTMSFAVYA